MDKRVIVASIVLLLLLGGLVGVLLLREETTGEEEGDTGEQDRGINCGVARVTLVGAGASFLHPQVDLWAREFSKVCPNVRIDYSPIGSGAGQRQFLEKVVDFAGTDPPLVGDIFERARADPRGLIQIPVVVGAVVVVYNIPELGGAKLRLTGEVIALIYLGEIEYWDDPRIAALNPGLRLPNKPIIAVHRSDASGTTNIFTQFLFKSSGGIWPRELVGLAVNWPVAEKGRALGGKGNAGVAEIVARTPYSIGYLEYSHAVLAGLPWALIRNRDGVFVDATPETIAAAAAGAYAFFPVHHDGDFSRAWSEVIFAPGRNAYPIASFSFLIFYRTYPAEKIDAIKAFIQWIMTEGSKHMVQGYVAMPQEVREYNLRAVELIRSS
ncbi:MAG: phosphate ABC transporter substrate-binding protein PstS [Acidilobaceae archaeon]